MSDLLRLPHARKSSTKSPLGRLGWGDQSEYRLRIWADGLLGEAQADSVKQLENAVHSRYFTIFSLP